MHHRFSRPWSGLGLERRLFRHEMLPLQFRPIRLRYGAWQRVPKKFRITWRPKPADYPDWNSAARARADLPFSPRHESSAQRQEPVGLRLVSSNSSPLELAPEMPTFRDWRRLKASA